MPLLFKTPEPRNQIKMFSLENLIPQDSEVRLLDELADSFFEKQDLNNISGIQNAKTGASAFSPKEMLKLLMYGYRNHINSSRRLEAATYNNIEVMFLLGNLHPSYHTIASFRAANKDLFESFFVFVRNTVLALCTKEPTSAAIDGTKFKAYASKTTLQKCRDELRKAQLELVAYLNESERLDHIEDVEEENIALREELEQAKGKLQALEAKVQNAETKVKEEEAKPQRFVNDPDARCMKHKGGHFEASYNTQVVVEKDLHVIMNYAVTNDANDVQQLAPVSKETLKIAENSNIDISTMVGDSGYCNAKQIQEIEKQGVECVIGVPKIFQKEKDKENGITFEYDQNSNTVRCCQGKSLTFVSTKQHRGINYDVFKASKKDCATCPLRDKCTKSKHGRSVWVSEEHEWKENYRLKMEQQENKQLLRERFGLVENVFGTIKYWAGKCPLFLTTMEKVGSEIALYFNSYNFVRFANLCGFTNTRLNAI
ncbi:MAG: IS1182 family transposase [Proteobacteria bacterium]|nr:IS1182 family transposase [Pseudomonadota bacterium]